VILDPPLGSVVLGPVYLPLDRVAVMLLALLLTLLLYLVLRSSKIGRASSRCVWTARRRP